MSKEDDGQIARKIIIDPGEFWVYIGDDLLPLDTVIKEYREQLEALSQIMKWRAGWVSETRRDRRMQRGLKGSCPIRAGKIVALLLQLGCQDHADLVGVVRSRVRPSPLPEQPRAPLADIQPAHLPEPDILTPIAPPRRKQAPRQKRTPYNNKAANLKQRPRRPRMDDTQAALVREAIARTGLPVSAWVRKILGNRYETVYAISPDPGMRVPLAPHIVTEILDALGLSPDDFANLLVNKWSSQ